jgi:nucleolin
MGKEKTVDWKEAILSTLKGGSEEGSKSGSLLVKKLRKLVLLSLQFDKDDKAAKKQFKKVVQGLEEEGALKLDSEGNVTLKRENKKEKKEKKSKRKSSEPESKVETSIKKRRIDDSTENDGDDDETSAQHDEEIEEPTESSEISGSKNQPCKGNPQGVTRLFLGNLPFAIDEASLGAFLPGKITHIKWITDKETGKFYGSAFIEMDNSRNAAAAVAMAGQQIMGRNLKINFAEARPGDIWPPPKQSTTTGGQAGGSGVKAMSEKPEGCFKLFVGNLSYDIDDDGITKFFANVGAEVKAVRWIHHQDTGDFKGVGFVEFWNTEACEKGATLNGKNLLGRPIRIDWSD